jgi:hypothetical protein
MFLSSKRSIILPTKQRPDSPGETQGRRNVTK